MFVFFKISISDIRTRLVLAQVIPVWGILILNTRVPAWYSSNIDLN
jgi:hypothetical protein